MIVGTFNKIPSKQSSHSYGWARTWSDNLGIDIDHSNGIHDTVYLLHGANFAGGLNLFGGYNYQLDKSIDNLLMAKRIVSLEIPCPDYGAMLAKRKDVEDKAKMAELSSRLADIEVLEQTDLGFTWLAVGDSHTAAYSRAQSEVIKRDGTTLWGQCRDDFEYIRSHIKPHHKGITISLGNIDIRHHVCRHDTSAMYSLLDMFVSFIESLDLDVEVSAPWPIEFEERRLPKSGQYKGTNFYGPLSLRQVVAGRWIEYLEEKGIKLVKPPQEWYSTDPKLYAETYMERPQSVHLNPMYYRRCNWGIPSNTLESFF